MFPPRLGPEAPEPGNPSPQSTAILPIRGRRHPTEKEEYRMSACKIPSPERAPVPAEPGAAPRILAVLAAGLCLALGAMLLLIGIGTAHAFSLIAPADMAQTGDFALVAVTSVLASALACVMVLRRQLGRVDRRRDGRNRRGAGR